ncbi:MAG: hypothetical protein JW849_06555 [Phycisphaerae bacterium]|nr:hypothetical protein [Phycisphaerae bacterium]
MKPSTPSSLNVTSVLSQVQSLLEQGRPETALGLLNDFRQNSPLLENAKGVCLLRLGKPDDALKIFRALVFPGGAFAIPGDTPIVYHVNYITTFFLLENVIIGIQLLRDIPQKNHPLVRQLNDSVNRWKRSLSWWRRMLLPIGLYPNRPLRLDFAPGAVWIPDEKEKRPRPAERAA